MRTKGLRRAGLLALPWLLALPALVEAVAVQPAMTPRDWARFSVLTPAGPAEPRPEVFRKIKRLVWAEHKVARGEYRERLAKLYRTTAMALQATNEDELFTLNPGRKIVVLNQDGRLYEVKKDSETLASIVAKVYRVYGDPRKARRFKEWAVKANGLPGSALIDEYYFEKGERLLLPGIKVNFDTYHFPFANPGWQRISSRFGMRRHPIFKERRAHVGIDIPKPYGTPVCPARSGTVVEAGWREGYGMLVVIRHKDGWTTRYGHLSRIGRDIKPGRMVQRGKTLIGNVGSTGHSTGPHLHFEVRDRRGTPINPTAKIGRR